tara:strand:+ start:115 stop:357 length:243 start_codon:yes stop_codon:yes gene_type:complete
MSGTVEYQLGKIKKPLSDAELIERCANAAATYANALGHGKAEDNRQNFEAWKAELAKRGVKCPSDAELYKQGTFNGIGSY